MRDWIAKLKRFAKLIKQELQVYQLVLKHPQTPMAGKILLWLAVGYLLLPFDLIPDMIPVLGQLDDLVLVPLLVFIALKLIPQAVIADCRDQQNSQQF